MNDREMYELLCKKSQNIKMKIPAGDIAAIALRFREFMDSEPGEWMYVRDVPPMGELKQFLCKRCMTSIYVENNDYRFCPYCGGKMK